MKKKFSVVARLHSVRYALNGCCVLLTEEHNSRVHVVAAVAVVILALVLGASVSDWIVLIFAIALVWITEALNTCIENLCDLYSTEFNPQIGKIKDIAAAAVFIASLAAIICGLLVFVPLVF